MAEHPVMAYQRNTTRQTCAIDPVRTAADRQILVQFETSCLLDNPCVAPPCTTKTPRLATPIQFGTFIVDHWTTKENNMPRVLISGANRGIGLELARQFSEAGWQVIGTARQPVQAEALAATGAQVLPLHADDEASILALKATLKETPIDVLIANAGIALNLDAGPGDVTRKEFSQTIRTNTWGPLALARALKPNIAASELRLCCAMSSLMSSISANDWGTQYGYRASKAALNAAWIGLADEWRPDGITCLLLRPGMVATDMTEGRGIPVQQSVGGMKQVIEGLSPADAGRIIGYDGLDVPW